MNELYNKLALYHPTLVCKATRGIPNRSYPKEKQTSNMFKVIYTLFFRSLGGTAFESFHFLRSCEGKGKGKGKASLLALAVAKAKGKGKGKNIEETAASQKLADVPEDQENQDKKTPPKLRKKKSIKPKDVQTKEMEPKDTGKALEGRKRLRRSKTPREMKEEVAEDEQQEPEETEETEESNEHQEQKAALTSFLKPCAQVSSRPYQH